MDCFPFLLRFGTRVRLEVDSCVFQKSTRLCIRTSAVQLAFTIAWMTVSSLLAHYKLKYGPAILLQMNIAYFLPSIPLLLISSCLDEWLDHTLGDNAICSSTLTC